MWPLINPLGNARQPLLILAMRRSSGHLPEPEFFSPLDVDEQDEIYHVMILMLQCAYFGPFPDKYVQFSDDLTSEYFQGIEGLVAQRGGRTRYRNTLRTLLSGETVDFLDGFMKLDPRDRPSAQVLLQDQWLAGVGD